MDDSATTPGAFPEVGPAEAWAWLSEPPEALLEECRQSRFQGSGPGGQKRNRVYSGVRVKHSPSGLTAESVDSRASARNLGEALSRLRLALALAGSAGADADPAPGVPFRSGASPSHPDYARCALRALALLRAHAGQLAPAAAALGCTPSALTRFLKEEKAVWARAREIRLGHGLHPLK
jgi:hypothetical protein